MLRKGLDFRILKIICSNCGWNRKFAHTGIANGKRAIVKIYESKDSSHVLDANVKEIPVDLTTEYWKNRYPDYEDLVSKAYEIGLHKALERYSNLLNKKNCPRCKRNDNLNLNQEWCAEHPRY